MARLLAKRAGLKTKAEQEEVSREIKALRLEENKLLAVDVQRAKDLQNTDGLHFSYAMSCYLLDDFEKAKKHIKIALDQQPESQQYLQAVTLLLEKMEEFEAASQYVDRLLKMDPSNRGYQQMKMRILLNMKKQ